MGKEKIKLFKVIVKGWPTPIDSAAIANLLWKNRKTGLYNASSKFF